MLLDAACRVWLESDVVVDVAGTMVGDVSSELGCDVEFVRGLRRSPGITGFVVDALRDALLRTGLTAMSEGD